MDEFTLLTKTLELLSGKIPELKCEDIYYLMYFYCKALWISVNAQQGKAH